MYGLLTKMRARWSHLARSGLPTVSRKENFPESHIINPLLTKFVHSRWLDIGQVLFLRVYGPLVFITKCFSQLLPETL